MHGYWDRSDTMYYTFLRFPEFRRKAVTLSYDDGSRCDKQLIEIMNRYGLRGTFNLNTGLEPMGRRMTHEELIELFSDSPHEVAIHGARHYSLPEVDVAAATKDVLTDRENLERMFGRIVKGMAYANGSTNEQVIQILKNCGVKYARTGQSTGDFRLPEDWYRMPGTCHHDSPRLMDLAKEFVERTDTNYPWANWPMLFYLWGHSYEFEDNNNWEVIEEFASYVGNRPDIWYATNGEIYDYVQDFKRLEYSVDGKMIANPTSTGVYLYHYGRNVFVPAGETVTL